MNLSKLAAKPQLVKITVDDAEIVEKYGEELDFYVYDRHDIDTFMSLGSVDASNNTQIVSLIKEMVFDEDGNTILADGMTLPIDIMSKVIEKVVSQLGNLTSQTIPE
jgi:hypothetical protein|tara:strand:- start:2537 stop:2857 length:321 start_codon:yes stop_codon:yes gene_type:complete